MAYPCPGGFEACPVEGLQCGVGYSGPLCGVCEPGYEPRQDGEVTLCESCPDATVNHVLLAVGIPSAVFLLCIFVENTLKTADKTDNMSSVYSKILLNNVQFLDMAALLPYQWPGAVEQIMAAQVMERVWPPSLAHQRLKLPKKQLAPPPAYIYRRVSRPRASPLSPSTAQQARLR